MSYFTHIQTGFKNLYYLEKALTKLNISFCEKEETKSGNLSLLISQSNDHEIQFVYNGQDYELVTDISFWERKYPIEVFIDKIAQKYANYAIVGESQKIGFQPIEHKQNVDGSSTLILERWK
jgi:hypothetical protein